MTELTEPEAALCAFVSALACVSILNVVVDWVLP